MELVLLGTTRIKIYKNVFRLCYLYYLVIEVTCFMVVYGLVILFDYMF